MADMVPKQIYDELMDRYDALHTRHVALLTRHTAEITGLERDKKAVETLRLATKLRFLLERLEKIGKEPGLTCQEWWESGRRYKWNFLVANSGRHSCIQAFVNCIGIVKNDTLVIDTVFTLYRLCEQVIHAHFFGSPTDLTYFQSSRIRKVVDCLIQNECEIMAAFNSLPKSE